MTHKELAIVRTVMYASLFEYPLTVDQLHESLVESDLTTAEILAAYGGSDTLQRTIAFRDGYFFPAGQDRLIAERRLREARSRVFLARYNLVLRLICALPFTRMVALSGSIAHLNLERGGDLDLFIVTRGPHAWTVAVATLLLTKLLRRRRAICANFVIADSQLTLDQQDLFSANQVIHLKPLIGAEVLDELLTENPFVRRIYPNALASHPRSPLGWHRSRALESLKSALEMALALPSPLLEQVCRRLYTWYLRRRARFWRSPEQVQLDANSLKLHTHSHRDAVLSRFNGAVGAVVDQSARVGVRRAV